MNQHGLCDFLQNSDGITANDIVARVPNDVPQNEQMHERSLALGHSSTKH